MCRPQTLVKNLACRIDRCSCGNIHVNIGPFTLRLDPAVFSLVSRALGDADQALDGNAPPPPSEWRRSELN